MHFYLVDVFTARPLAGNQLAVCFCDAALDTNTMQSIAREINFSETTFVTGGSNETGFDVRIFTPAQELPFAGHPVIGTAAVLMRHDNTVRAPVTLNLGIGAVKVAVNNQDAKPVYWLEGPPVNIEETLSCDEICAITGNRIQDIDSDFPVQRLRVGPVFTLIPFRTLQALDAMQLDVSAYRGHFGQAQMSEVYGVTQQARDHEHDLSVRLLFDAAGVREDAATGSAAVCLGAWLLNNTSYLGMSSYALKVEQGGLIGRPSTLHINGTLTDGDRTVKVGGKVAFVASGDWLV